MQPGLTAPPVVTGPDDASVIRLALTDPEQFAAIFDRYFTAIHRYLSRRVGTQLADDLTGETFLVALRRLRSYDLQQRSARPWLYGIATNLLRRHRRTETRHCAALARTGPPPVTDNHDEAVSDRVTAQTMTRSLAEALASLSAAERDVLLLVAWADLSTDEIAHALGIAPGAVRVRLHRARTKTRTALDNGDHR